MPVMYRFNELLEAYRHNEADDDGRDVNEEVPPGVDRFVRGVSVEHRSGDLRDGRGIRI